MSTSPVQGDHTAATVWDVDGSAYSDDTDCTPAVRHCNTIGAAVAAASPGDTIQVAAGTYAESLVIDKELELRGAQADVDPRPSEGGRSGDEAVIVSDGTAVTILNTSFVRFNGFTIESNIEDKTLPAILVQNTSIPRISHNIIHNVDGAQSGDAIRVENTRGTGFTVDHNHIHDMPGPGSAIRAHTTTSGNVSFNEINSVTTDGGGVYYTDSIEPVARANLLHNITGFGIVFGNHTGADNLLDMGPAHGWVTDNVVQNTTESGVLVQMSDVNVLRNVVLDGIGDLGAVHIRPGELGVATSLIIGTPDGLLLNGFRIQDNCLFDNLGGLGVSEGVNGSTVEVHNNNIAGNSAFGAASETEDPINATWNWWGHPSGPSGEGPGSGDAVLGAVLFDPWLTEQAAGTACTPPPGCQGPEEVEARSRADGDIVVEWSAVDDADGHNVYRAQGSGKFSRLTSVDSNTTSYTDAETEVGKAYRYQVTAVINGTETEACETATATAIPVFPSIVAGLLAALVGIGAYVAFRRRRQS